MTSARSGSPPQLSQWPSLRWQPIKLAQTGELGALLPLAARDARRATWGTKRSASQRRPSRPLHRAVLVFGAQVLVERERFRDGYMLVAD